MHFLNSPAYGTTWNTTTADHIISVYPFTYLSVMQGLLVFSFPEACHHMVDTRPPIKTFLLDLHLYFRYSLLGSVPE